MYSQGSRINNFFYEEEMVSRTYGYVVNYVDQFDFKAFGSK